MPITSGSIDYGSIVLVAFFFTSQSCETFEAFASSLFLSLFFSSTQMDKPMADAPRHVFYHGCSDEAWTKTQEQGFLLHPRGGATRGGVCPVVYLAVSKDEAVRYGPVLLAVQYEPGSGIDNYCEGCWQFRVYTPIPLLCVKRLV